MVVLVPDLQHAGEDVGGEGVECDEGDSVTPEASGPAADTRRTGHCACRAYTQECRQKCMRIHTW